MMIAGANGRRWITATASCVIRIDVTASSDGVPESTSHGPNSCGQLPSVRPRT
jgi:hypothetical protein